MYVFLTYANAENKNQKTFPHFVTALPEGRFSPLFGLDKNQKNFLVNAFYLDKYLVTQKNFYDFIKKHNDWSKEKVKKIYVDQNYLKNWKPIPPKHLMNTPVVFVSWFAANAYCESKNGRLPTVLEWEYAAAADTIKPNALMDPIFNEKLLNWYQKPTAKILPKVGLENPNYYGIFDMHGLVWEWNADFNSSFVTGDNRQDGEQNKGMFCGAGATGAVTRLNYAGFMRYAMRNSLEGQFAQHNLGFRCAYDQNPEIKR